MEERCVCCRGGVFTAFLLSVAGFRAQVWPWLVLVICGPGTDAAHTAHSQSSCWDSSRLLKPPLSAFSQTESFRVSVTVLPLHRNEDLKEMLESNKESLKLEAMKRVVGVSGSPGFSSPVTDSQAFSHHLNCSFFSADRQREKCIGAVSCRGEERRQQKHRGMESTIRPTKTNRRGSRRTGAGDCWTVYERRLRSPEPVNIDGVQQNNGAGWCSVEGYLRLSNAASQACSHSSLWLGRGAGGRL